MDKLREEREARARLREQLARGSARAMWELGAGPLTLSEVLEGAREALSGPRPTRAVQAYVHFPYCAKSCSFCQYWHEVPQEREQFSRYADHLLLVMRRHREVLGRVKATSAYFGGGTPTALPVADLERMLLAFGETFAVAGEFTCEAHPGTLDERKLALLADAGVNRLSLGVQSFDPAVLDAIHRTNKPPEKLARLIDQARAAAMQVNVDLVAGLPAQTAESLRADLRRLFAMGPHTITVYRFLPVNRLDHVAPEELRYSRVFTKEVLGDAVRAGFLPFVHRADDAPGVRFFRPGRWMVERYGNRLRAAGRGAPLPSYDAPEDAPERHVLALGVGGEGHVHGRVFYRELTKLALADGRREPVLWGSRLTPEDEAFVKVASLLAKGDAVRLDEVLREDGLEESAFARGIARTLERCGLRAADGSFRRPRTIPDAVFPDLVAPLLEPWEARWTAPALHRALPAPFDYEIGFLPGSEVWPYRPPTEPAAVKLGRPPRGSSEAIAELLAKAGAREPGDHLAGAPIARIAEEFVSVRAGEGPLLDLLVRRPDGKPAFITTSRFAVSYRTRPDAPLRPEEERVLETLRDLAGT